MSSIEDLKRRIGDIHGVASRLGLKRPDPKGNYCSPHHDDKNPSLQIGGTKYPDGWYDHSRGIGGDVIDLVKYVLGGDTAAALKWLRQQYGIHDALPVVSTPNRQKTLVEHIADRCTKDPQPALAYLTGRGIAEEVVQRAIRLKTVGFNDYSKPSRSAGTKGYGGPATAFIVRTLNPGTVVAVDFRYHDPALNGGDKTKSIGEKVGYPWMMDPAALRHSHTVVFVESATNALTAETAFLTTSRLSGCTAIALRGTSHADKIDTTLLREKRVIVCMDRDEPDKNGVCAGDSAAWKLYDRLLADNIACHFVDQDDWPVNDLNELLRAQNVQVVARALLKFSPWAIPGVPGKYQRGRVRVFLPSADYSIYYSYRVREDFTVLMEVKEVDDENGSTREQITPRDLAGFRVAAVSKVAVANSWATMTGRPDHLPRLMYAVSIQTSYQQTLMREVIPFEDLHNIEFWKKLGPIFRKEQFLRLVNIWGRATDIGQREATNFVGLCYRNGRLVVNEGPDCYFTDPDHQCTYHNFRFPSGDRRHAATVIRAYAKTFGMNAATQLLTWTLGAHLKTMLSFWPHLTLQAQKGRGKTTLLERLAGSTGFKLLSGQSIQTEYRIISTVGFTTQPVGWEELSSRRQEIIDRAVNLLQETYKFLPTQRGPKLTEHLLCAPVLLAGEDVPVRSLMGKVVRVSLKDKGPLLPTDLPVFPVRQWLDFLTTLDPQQVQALHERAADHCQAQCRAPLNDDGAMRMVRNYAAVAVAWKLLLEFAELEESEFGFIPHLLAEMNNHIATTEAERQPWVWILDTILNEIAADAYPYPYRIDEYEGEEVLMLLPKNVMHHLATKSGLRAMYDSLPVKTPAVFKSQLKEAGVIVKERFDPLIDGQRVSHMMVLSVEKLAGYGLHPQAPIEKRRYS